MASVEYELGRIATALEQQNKLMEKQLALLEKDMELCHAEFMTEAKLKEPGAVANLIFPPQSQESSS